MTQHYQPGDEPIAGYRLKQFLGRGGFGQVWKALGPGGTEVAVKFIGLDRRCGLRELAAVKLVRRIRHPNLVSITGFWLKDARGNVLNPSPEDSFRAGSSAAGRGDSANLPAELVLVMGLGDENLFDRLEASKQAGLPGIPPEELCDYLEDAARGIDFLNSPCHDLGAGPIAVQHCDIKPQNILLVGGAAQVCDFGLARALGDVRLTTMGVTVAYGAPECLEGQAPSQATDQYSLAISYVELRTGQLPFDDESSPGKVVEAHLSGNLDLSKLSPAEQDVIRRATALRPEDRFPTSLSMVRALRQACGCGSRDSAGEREYQMAAAVRGSDSRRDSTGKPQSRATLMASGSACVAAAGSRTQETRINATPGSAARGCATSGQVAASRKPWKRSRARRSGMIAMILGVVALLVAGGIVVRGGRAAWDSRGVLGKAFNSVVTTFKSKVSPRRAPDEVPLWRKSDTLAGPAQQWTTLEAAESGLSSNASQQNPLEAPAWFPESLEELHTDVAELSLASSLQHEADGELLLARGPEITLPREAAVAADRVASTAHFVLKIPRLLLNAAQARENQAQTPNHSLAIEKTPASIVVPALRYERVVVAVGVAVLERDGEESIKLRKGEVLCVRGEAQGRMMVEVDEIDVLPRDRLHIQGWIRAGDVTPVSETGGTKNAAAGLTAN